ncbi:MAG: hypothetical protein KAI64_04755 [Thermoplasmata archaeon]|nr:hypothetical protein [Thermoplasmata archaeon]
MDNVILIRTHTSDHGTEGLLFAKGQRFYTMEPPDRDNQVMISSIPAGTYTVIKRWSQKYKIHYWITKIPGRTVCLIHPGNVGGDRSKKLLTHTWGCLLLGLARGTVYNQRAILSSKTAVRRFTSLMAMETFKLYIMEATHGIS